MTEILTEDSTTLLRGVLQGPEQELKLPEDMMLDEADDEGNKEDEALEEAAGADKDKMEMMTDQPLPENPLADDLDAPDNAEVQQGIDEADDAQLAADQSMGVEESQAQEQPVAEDTGIL